MDDASFRGSRFVNRPSTITIGRRRSKKNLANQNDQNFSQHNFFCNGSTTIQYKSPSPNLIEKPKKDTQMCNGDYVEIIKPEKVVKVKQKLRKSSEIGNLMKKYRKQSSLNLKMAIHQIQTKIDELTKIIEEANFRPKPTRSKLEMEGIESKIVHSFFILIVIFVYICTIWMAIELFDGKSRWPPTFKIHPNQSESFLSSFKNFFRKLFK